MIYNLINRTGFSVLAEEAKEAHIIEARSELTH